MVACAKFLGRTSDTCTRGGDLCICKIEENGKMNNSSFEDKAKEILRKIGYPKRGTEEEKMDVFDCAKLIQDTFTLDELEK